MNRLLLALGGLSLFAPTVTAQTTLSLTPYLEVLRIIEVVVGRDTFDFLLDTGGGVTTVSPGVAARLGCGASGRITGFRMRGERVTTPSCADVALSIGGQTVRTDVGVFDMMTLIGSDRPAVDGMVSLQTFAGRAITLDLAGGTLVIETPRSLRRRVARATELRGRLANGQAGNALDLFLEVPGHDRGLWLLWDSGHIGPLYLAPHAAPLLGLDTAVSKDAALHLSPTTIAQTRYAIRDIIYDGVIGQPLIARYRWTIDLGTGRVWVTPVGDRLP
jgi:hypothetical protein